MVDSFQSGSAKWQVMRFESPDGRCWVSQHEDPGTGTYWTAGPLPIAPGPSARFTTAKDARLAVEVFAGRRIRWLATWWKLGHLEVSLRRFEGTPRPAPSAWLWTIRMRSLCRQEHQFVEVTSVAPSLARAHAEAFALASVFSRAATAILRELEKIGRRHTLAEVREQLARCLDPLQRQKTPRLSRVIAANMIRRACRWLRRQLYGKEARDEN